MASFDISAPLLKNTVRFLDNFSGGSRGSISAEQFLTKGYAVIFLSRRGSLQPFLRHLQHDNALAGFQADGNQVVLHSPEIADAIRTLEQCKERLLTIPFVSVHDYLYLFRALCCELLVCGPSAMVYAAAAVSDFYIPQSKMVTHKIQSAGGGTGLTISLDPVPKLLPFMQDWCPEAFTVTFKLETDASILEHKVHASFKYGQRAIVGNLLDSHREMVHLYFAEGSEHVVVKRQQDLIEKQFVTLLCERHQTHIEKNHQVH